MTLAITTILRKPLAPLRKPRFIRSGQNPLSAHPPKIGVRSPSSLRIDVAAAGASLRIMAANGRDGRMIRFRPAHETPGNDAGADASPVGARPWYRRMQPQDMQGAVMAGSCCHRQRRARHGSKPAFAKPARFYTEQNGKPAPSSRSEFVAAIRPLIEAVYEKLLPLDFSHYIKVHEHDGDYVLWRKGRIHVLSVDCGKAPDSGMFYRPRMSIPLATSDEERALASENYRSALARRVRSNPKAFFPFSLEFHSEYDVLAGKRRNE